MKTKTNKIDGSFRHAELGLARHPENAKLKELVDLGREASCLDHNHESATNWLHTVTTNPAFSDAGKKRLEYNKAHDNLMAIQDKQDACLRRIIELRTELSR